MNWTKTTCRLNLISLIIGICLTLGHILIAPLPASAYDSLIYEPQIEIPTDGGGKQLVGTYDSETGIMSSNLLARYLKAIYDYGLGIVGILAVIVMMIGGVLWLTSAGNDSRIAKARELIIGGLIGLALLLGSWILLNTINPELLKFKTIATQVAKPQNFMIKVKCEWRCVDTGLKCEGAGNDTIKATSLWQSAPASSCSAAIRPLTPCPDSATQSYACCCAEEKNLAGQVTTDEKAAAIAPCLDSLKTAGLKPIGSSCLIGDIAGYCGHADNSMGIECLPCKKIGETCDNNMSGNYACINENGTCGSEDEGDCNASPRDGGLNDNIMTFLESSTLKCNSHNRFSIKWSAWLGWETNLWQGFIDCKCK